MGGLWKGWLIAGAAAFAWLAMMAAWLLSGAADTTPFPLLVLLACAPIALIVIAADAMRRLERATDEVAILAEEIAERDEAGTARGGAVQVPATNPQTDAKLEQLIERQRVTDRALLSLLEGRAADRNVLSEVAQNAARAAARTKTPLRRMQPPRMMSAGGGQPSLPFAASDTAETPEGPSWPDTLRALNFPQDQDDEAGFRAMRRSMQDRQVAQVLRAAEDILNLLSQDGIYMDDLDPVAAEPSLWRRFAEGERGASMSGLAAIDDATALSLTRGRMRSDDVMRDAALHFIRHFDILLKSLCERLDDDEELARLRDTRTGRAFMLLVTVTGALE